MSAPTWVATGSQINPTGSGTPAWPTGHQANDIGILLVETANQAVAVPSGWTECPDSPQGVGTAGAAGAVRLHAFWKRAASGTEAGPTLPDVGDHMRALIVVFRGCETSGSPFNVTAGNTEPAVTTSVTIPGDTTTVDECLIFALVANATDTSANQTTAGGFANASLVSVTRVVNGNTPAGVGGGIDGVIGVKTAAGLVETTTTTLNTASAQARLMLALKPPASAPATVTKGGFWIGTGEKATAGVVSSTTGTMDDAAPQARIFLALKPPASAPANLPPEFPPISSKTAFVDTELTFPVDATDPEDEAITYTLVAGATPAPADATVELLDDGSYAFTWTPVAADIGTWDFGIHAEDASGNSTERFFQITVSTTTPDATTAAEVADRAVTDLTTARELVNLLKEREQYNAQVWDRIGTLLADLDASLDYMEEVQAALENPDA